MAVPYRRIHKVVRRSALGSAVLVLLLGACALHFSYDFFNATSWVNHTTEVIAQIRGTRVLLRTLEPNPTPGPRNPASASVILNQFDRVTQLTRDNALQQENALEFRRLLSSQRDRDGTLDASTVQAAHALLGNMQSEEFRLLAVRVQSQIAASRNAAIAVTILCVALLIVGLILAVAARREFRLRATAEKTLQLEKQELTNYSRELALVTAGSELIQAAEDEARLNAAVTQIVREMLPESNGYYGVVSPSQNSVEIAGSWGSGQVPKSLSLSDCAALQLGRKIHRNESLVHLPCRHVHGNADSICIPLRGPSGSLGLIYVESADQISKKCADSIGLFAAQVTLGLINLRMRETLRGLSVRDSLTGLFNRRYFDETLLRELACYRRDGAPISILMLDVDHFKRLNDNFGHAVGDDALRALGDLMRASFRESDVICRYGGEEFAVILLNSDLASGYAKAESFRRTVERADLSWNGRDMGRITASIGVACCTEFGETDAIVQAADTALYQAKRMGRNSSCVCSSLPVPMPVVQAPALGDSAWPIGADTSLTNERAAGRGSFSRIQPITSPPTRPA